MEAGKEYMTFHSNLRITCSIRRNSSDLQYCSEVLGISAKVVLRGTKTQIQILGE